MSPGRLELNDHFMDQRRHPRSSSLAPRSGHEGTGNAEENTLHRGRNGDSESSAGNGQCNSLSSFASVYPLSPKFLSSGTPGPAPFRFCPDAEEKGSWSGSTGKLRCRDRNLKCMSLPIPPYLSKQVDVVGGQMATDAVN